MIGRVLGRLTEGATTVGALAAELGVDRPRLERMLDLLSRLGYIERVDCGQDRATSGRCHGCAGSAMCDVATERDAGGRPVAYVLTRKGLSAGGKSKSREGHAGRADGPYPGRRAGDQP